MEQAVENGADPALAGRLEGLESQFGGVSPTIDVWVDRDGLARRMVMTLDGMGGAAAQVGMVMTMDFRDYGQPVDIVVPDPADTADYSELMQGLPGMGGNGTTGN